MNLDGLFTVVALLVAVYAILPSAKRMSISFYLGRISGVIALLSFLIIIWLHYYHIFYTPDISTPHFHVLGYILTPYDASFGVFLIAVVMILSIYLMRRKIMLPYKIVKFHELILQLYDEEKYSDILLLVYDNLNWIKKVHGKEFWIFNIYEHFVPKVIDLESFNKRIKNKNGNKNISIKKRIISWLSRFSGQKEAEVAYQIINMVHTDKNLIKVMAFNRNDIAISILGKELGDSRKLAGIYISYLIKDKNSVLYSELWEGKNSRKILIFLFDDCKKAIDLDIWQPIGEYVIEELNELYIRKDMSQDVYNRSTELYEEDANARFMEESPLFTGVLFFDEMVRSALNQNIKHNMFLLYFRYFVERVLRNLSPDKDVNMEDEFPTHYHHLLSDIVFKLYYWIHIHRGILLSQENIKSDNECPFTDEDIMETAIATLGEIVYRIMICGDDKMGTRFKFDIMRIVYGCYFELMNNDKTKIFAQDLIKAVRRGKVEWGYRKNRTPLQYKKILLEAANNNEVVDMAINGKFVTKLREILQDDIDKHEE